jgi:hypothetical protein
MWRKAVSGADNPYSLTAIFRTPDNQEGRSCLCHEVCTCGSGTKIP